MKKLIIMRHARSEMHSADGSDFGRALTPEGLIESAAAGDYLLKMNVLPDYILSSSALRAAQTAEKVAVALGISASSIKLDSFIYHSSDSGLIDRISEMDDKIDTLLVVGHNPTVTALVRKVSEVRIDNMPPGSLIVLNYQVSAWAEWSEHTGEYLFFARPPFTGHK